MFQIFQNQNTFCHCRCDRVNTLVDEMKAQLGELALGFKGELTMYKFIQTFQYLHFFV